MQTNFYLKIDGSDASVDLVADIEQISVESSLHLPAVATLVIYDPKLRWVDSDCLAPGKELTISAKVDRTIKLLFDGEIVEIEPDFSAERQVLVVRAFDRLHRLARGRYARSFINVSDGDLVQKIAGEAGLSAQVAATSQVHPYVLQANQTNLAFLQQRAAALGYLLYVREKILYCKPPKDQGSSIALSWQQNMISFRPRLSSIGQFDSVTVRSWDVATKKEIVGQAQRGSATPSVGAQPGNPFNMEPKDLVADCRIRTQAEADKLAQAVANRHASRFIEADGECLGQPAISAGASVDISGVGTRFSGAYFVTSATHTYNADSGYTTHFTVSGLNPSTLLGVLLPEAAATGPGNGLMIGIVTDINDPNKQGRVKVKFPWLTPDHASDWARVAHSGAGAGRGLLFMPEVNDEVLVGFEQGDMLTPYVLGGLWNGKDAPPGEAAKVIKNGKVEQRLLYSRAGHQIILDDSEQNAGVTVIDKNGNKLEIKSQNNMLTITTKGDISITTDTNLSLKAGGNLALEATGNLSLKANSNLTAEAGAQAGIKGAAGMKVESSAIVEVKGAMINLN
jgi:phage protein D/phage baseplate assembly protein gpV